MLPTFNQISNRTRYNINKKVLTAIVTIDRDIDLAPSLYIALLNNKVKDILVVTRDSDTETVNYWQNKATVFIINHYEINARHNMEALAKERQMVMDYAKQNNYDYIWFVDSDVIPIKGTLRELLKTKKDICISPYRTKWTGYPAVGIYSGGIKLHKVIPTNKKRQSCIIGGFGCTLLYKTTFNIKIEYLKLETEQGWVEGEDIGFFMACYNNGLSCEYLPYLVQPHYYDRFL